MLIDECVAKASECVIDLSIRVSEEVDESDSQNGLAYDSMGNSINCKSAIWEYSYWDAQQFIKFNAIKC